MLFIACLDLQSTPDNKLDVCYFYAEMLSPCFSTNHFTALRTVTPQALCNYMYEPGIIG